MMELKGSGPADTITPTDLKNSLTEEQGLSPARTIPKAVWSC